MDMITVGHVHKYVCEYWFATYNIYVMIWVTIETYCLCILHF